MARIVVETGKTYIGVVEDNNDPKKLGRCKIRVFDVFDGKNKANEYELKTKDLPWAFPWKDLNGNEFNLPEVGKIVTVIFENADQNNPEYISAEHYNINLENKLSKLSDTDYNSMKSLIFDHKTQIYVNDSEGLKLDHKFNNINIKEQSINLNLKDNFGKINLGTSKSTQRAILGDNFTNWLDELLNIFMSGAFLGNLSAPVIPSPELAAHIQLYQSIKDPKILSKNVYLVDNENVEKLDRIAIGQIGDQWQSTIENNQITKNESVPFTPVDGSSSTTFDQVKNGATNSTPAQLAPVVKDINPDIKIILEIIKNKNYTLFSKPYEMNIISVRNQCLKIGDKYTNEFVDKLYLMYKDDSDQWQLKQYVFSTIPGDDFIVTDNWVNSLTLDTIQLEYLTNKIGFKITVKEYQEVINDNKITSGVKILVPSQYLDMYEISTYQGVKSMGTRIGSKQMIWVDKDFKKPEFYPSNMSTPIKEDENGLSDFGIGIHLGYPGGKKVGNWSIDGSHVFSTKDELEDFFNMCSKHNEKYGNSFTYTLVTKTDWDNATITNEANKNDAIQIEPQKAKPDVVVKNKPLSKPNELKNSTDILAFQVFSNKLSNKIDMDGIWGNNSQSAWDSLKSKYITLLGGMNDSDLRLAQARMYPYGKPVKNSDGTYIFQSAFNNQKWTLNLFENKRFYVVNNNTGLASSKGNYDDGCNILNVTDGLNAGQTFKDDNTWNNIRKLVS